MTPDATLIARVMVWATPETAHDIRNMVSVYVGLAELADDTPEAAQYLPKITAKLEEVAAHGFPLPANWRWRPGRS